MGLFSTRFFFILNKIDCWIYFHSWFFGFFYSTLISSWDPFLFYYRSIFWLAILFLCLLGIANGLIVIFLSLIYHRFISKKASFSLVFKLSYLNFHHCTSICMSLEFTFGIYTPNVHTLSHLNSNRTWFTTPSGA